MINIDFLTLKAFFIENLDFIINSRVQKIQQPTRRDFIFSLRNNGVSKKLYININPQIYHLAFMSEENEKKRSLVIPKKPPMFCMLLRKYIEGAKICDARVAENERILELFFETFDELGDKRYLTLSAELMGKHSNIILYDRESSVIIGCAHNVGSEKSRYRELQGGLKYIYPPASEKKLSNELELEFEGLTQEKIDDYLNTETFRPAIKGDKYTLFQELMPDSQRVESVNGMVDSYYANVQESVNLKSEKLKLEEIVKGKLKKNKTASSKISVLLKKRDNTDRYKLYGDLLTANIYKKADYQKNVTVFDYVNNQDITIELDETKTMNENAQRYYKLYTKSKTTKEKSKEILSSLEIEANYLDNILYSITSAKNISELDDIKSELGIEEKQKEKKQTKPTLTKFNIEGFDVFVGKNNKQNDYIVSKLSSDEDFWFHTRTCAGSHVLLKTNGIEPDEKVLFECCKLAREYSSASLPSKVGVIYTKAKNLRKPPA
ncbi:NFACT family protein, partial [bacterium]|nr:NFACT family protein [bacterium]